MGLAKRFRQVKRTAKGLRGLTKSEADFFAVQTDFNSAKHASRVSGLKYSEIEKLVKSGASERELIEKFDIHTLSAWSEAMIKKKIVLRVRLSTSKALDAVAEFNPKIRKKVQKITNDWIMLAMKGFSVSAIVAQASEALDKSLGQNRRKLFIRFFEREFNKLVGARAKSGKGIFSLSA
ncbi:MAG: hypothetical protein Q7K42_04780 [Candidatus Diapherotrites archaeon]|nr:hypothetical protein [Candidatus Diapherotrites archaeon]